MKIARELIVPGGSGTGNGSGAPTDATYITQTANGSLSAEQALSSLATGVVKVTTGTGVLSTATEGTDYYKPGGTDVAIADGGTGASTAAAGFDALSPLTTQGDLLGYDGSHNIRIANGSALQVLRMNSGATGQEYAGGISQHYWGFIGGDTNGYNPVDATPFYLILNAGTIGADPSTTAPSASDSRMAQNRVPSRIVAIYLDIYTLGTLGSAETGTADIRINNSSNSQVLTGLQWNAAQTSYSATNLSVSLAVGDWFVIKITPPTWVTNPTTTFYTATVWATTPQ